MYNVALFLHLWDVMPCPERNVGGAERGDWRQRKKLSAGFEGYAALWVR